MKLETTIFEAEDSQESWTDS